MGDDASIARVTGCVSFVLMMGTSQLGLSFAVVAHTQDEYVRE